MKIKIVAVMCAVMCLIFSTGACARAENAEKNSPPAANAPPASGPKEPVFTCTSAGRWYPDDPAKLRNMVKGFLDKAEGGQITDRIVALIAPHAGYPFSGPVAAHAYKQLEGLHFDSVVVVGFSHHEFAPEIAVHQAGTFRTPLGDIPVDADLAAAIMAENPVIKYDPAIFVGEHSLDNQLPFLQMTLSGFTLVPILFGSQTPENINILSDALARALKGKNVLLVASSDMSHFWPQDEANRIDAETISRVTAFDADGIAQMMQGDSSGRKLCGFGAVQVVLRAAGALGADEARVLKYATSQDTFGPTGNGVVGYMAVALVDKKGKNTLINVNPKEAAVSASPEEKSMKPHYGGDLTEASQKELLAIARKSLETYIRTGKTYTPDSENPQLQSKRGVFVTLTINGALRGCMGWFEPNTPLAEIVARQAAVSATQDPRFPEVRPEELPAIAIEISVLSMPRYVDSCNDIVVGRDGVILEKGNRRATFLPQVAPEQGWDLAAMLSHLAMKAGLPADGWKQGARFQVYTAQVFGETE